MPQAILEVLLELLSLNHSDYLEEVREFESRSGSGGAKRGVGRSILERLAHELSAVPDDEVIGSWEEWLRPLQGILAEEMELIDRMEATGPTAPGEFRLLQAVAMSFFLMDAPSANVCDWVFSATVDCPEPRVRGVYVQACVRHLGATPLRRRLRTLVEEGPDHLKGGASEALNSLAG